MIYLYDLTDHDKTYKIGSDINCKYLIVCVCVCVCVSKCPNNKWVQWDSHLPTVQKRNCFLEKTVFVIIIIAIMIIILSIYQQNNNPQYVIIYFTLPLR